MTRCAAPSTPLHSSPTYYERIAHEGSHFSHDILNYTRTGSNVTAHARIWRQKKGEEMSTDTKTHQAQGTTLDMLSAFYYMRQLNYPAMNPGSAVKLNIFSGKKKKRFSPSIITASTR